MQLWTLITLARMAKIEKILSELRFVGWSTDEVWCWSPDWLNRRNRFALIKLPFSILKLLPSTTQSSAYCSLQINHKMNSVDTKSTSPFSISLKHGPLKVSVSVSLHLHNRGKWWLATETFRLILLVLTDTNRLDWHNNIEDNEMMIF